jgi:tRNA threonylcarbamoyladenosine biosynthesis protein TsaE
VGDLSIWHFDFYRFDDRANGKMQVFVTFLPAPDSSWQNGPKKAAAVTPVADIAIHIEAIDDVQRQVTLRPAPPQAAPCLKH